MGEIFRPTRTSIKVTGLLNKQVMLTLTESNSYSSLYLVEQINIFRALEGNKSELLHKNFLTKIDSEFEAEIAGLNFQPGSYLDKNNQQRKCYNLSFEDSLQMLMSESKTVRKAVLVKLEALKQQVLALTAPKAPQTYAQALVEAGRLATIVEEQQMLLLESQPKLEEYNKLHDSTEMYTFEQACKSILNPVMGTISWKRHLVIAGILTLTGQFTQKYINLGWGANTLKNWNKGFTNANMTISVTPKGILGMANSVLVSSSLGPF